MLNKVIVVVGEPSGDLLGAQLALELKKIYPNIEIEGVIGAEMIKAGCLQLSSMDVLSVMGLIEPLIRLPKILALRKWLLRYVLENPPDLFIGIDAPDFNLNIEKAIHKAGIPVVHYVSPSVWAWRSGRIKNIKQSVDLMLTLFPFETEFYKRHEVAASYVGHPTADKIPFVVDVLSAKEELGYKADDVVVAVLAGSRNSEMKNMVRTYLEAIKLCYQQRPDLKFIMPVVYEGHKEYIEYWRNKLIPEIKLKYVVGNSYLVMRAANYALVTSGTATLEVMLHKVPMIVAYKTNWPTYWLVKKLIKVKNIALPNLIANQQIVPEYVQAQATPQKLSSALLELIASNRLQQEQIEKFEQLHKELQQGASKKAAQFISDKFNHLNKEDQYADSWSR